MWLPGFLCKIVAWSCVDPWDWDVMFVVETQSLF